MTLNEILTRQNVLNAILLKDGENELGKELKVKMVRLRMALNKYKKSLDEEVQEFTKELVPEELKTLQEKPESERTEEENTRIKMLVDKVNSEYNEFMIQKGNEEVKFDTDYSFTDDDFDSIVAVNAGNEMEINGNKVKSEDLMEAFYELFVNKN